ncbi:MAG: 4-hydroxy-3-methylbut-2-enyl diphosphate reductase [Spirochaetales bacterium]|jgi:NagD protein|nr:4-hydroxy-3-methylbut-2-enyl diphosphate reductase [Spirochaetales bacterium]
MLIRRGKTIGICMGVKRVLELVEKLQKEEPSLPLCTVGPLIHNPLVLNKLAAEGVRIIQDPGEARTGVVVGRAHGLPRDVKEAFSRMPVRFVDGTCPRVLKTQDLAEKQSLLGYHIIIVGNSGHGEVQAIAGYVAGQNYTVLATPQEARACPLFSRNFVISQSTIRQEEYDQVCGVLKRRAEEEGRELKAVQTICPCTRDRQEALKELSNATDALLIIGGKDSANTIGLYRTALQLGKPVWHIESAREIPPEVFGCAVVGLSAGASTPEWIIRGVEQVLEQGSQEAGSISGPAGGHKNKLTTTEGRNMETLRSKKAFICDMDGVLYHGNQLLPGVKEFVEWLRKESKAFLFLTNASERSPRELQEKLSRLGIEVDSTHFYTSALATAGFLATQSPGGSAYVIGEAGLINALYDAGFSMNDINPDYVIVGESRTYNLETVMHAVKLVLNGAKLIGTNPDLTGPVEGGIAPATGSLISPIELATGSQAYFVGKPNPLMIRHAMKRLKVNREDTVIVGDRMDTDIRAGIEAGIEAVLVLSGVTNYENMKKFAYRPNYIFKGVGEIPHFKENGSGIEK